MKYCPSCHTEYQDSATTCADCQVPLVDFVPFCKRCDGDIAERDIFCPHCGVLLPGRITNENDVPECEDHPSQPAVGMCVVCGKPICRESVQKIAGKLFCRDDSHVKLYHDYALLYRTSTEYEAAMIKANLEGTGIPVSVFSQSDHVYFVTMGDLAVVNIMVPKTRIHEAQELLKNLLSSKTPFGDETIEFEDEEPGGDQG